MFYTQPVSQSNEATNAPIFGNPELFQADSDVEEEGLEKMQCNANAKIAAVRICNEKKHQDWEDWKQKEEDWKKEEDKEAKEKIHPR